jgi:hypothetical protein
LLWPDCTHFERHKQCTVSYFLLGHIRFLVISPPDKRIRALFVPTWAFRKRPYWQSNPFATLALASATLGLNMHDCFLRQPLVEPLSGTDSLCLRWRAN